MVGIINPYIFGGGLFKSSVYSGNDGASDIILSGVSSPALCWLKNTSNGGSSAYSHYVLDKNRSAGQFLRPNETSAEAGTIANTSFNSSTVSFGSGASNAGWNVSPDQYAAFVWQEKPGYLDIKSYTGLGGSFVVTHDLGVVPKMIIVKALNASGSAGTWYVYHASNTANPETDYLQLNTSEATTDDVNVWDDTPPTSTQFIAGSLIGSFSINYIAYVFGEVAGESAFGGYTGNGSTSGPTINLGWKPSLLLVKKSQAGGTNGSWRLFSSTWGDDTKSLTVNTNGAFSSNSPALVTLTSSGFNVTSSQADVNENTYDYIYAAWK